MHIPVSDAKGKLTDLVRRAEAGDEVILTRHGHPAVRLTPVGAKPSADEMRARRLAAIDRAVADARERGAHGGPSAARSQDYLYGDDGLPA
ncbi:MAG: type II toxin-antitoxin system prevent-host-death family antitoxin [Sphingomonadaceae bacterium]|nr:type II toxin-antitoxin system prevent-host-death family antitoxin [Sphingomonadaceae bacterium]